MPRFFLEVAYKGTAYHGFQVQENANTVQAEVEKAIRTLLPLTVLHAVDNQVSFLTGSSRTDAGVHAKQNFFHFDTVSPITDWPSIAGDNQRFVYKLNAILPGDIVVKGLHSVADDANCRFLAATREYKYYIYQQKNPFYKDRAFYFPYKLNLEEMGAAAALLMEYDDFTSFSKRNTQVKTFQCKIHRSCWQLEGDCLVYNVIANRFLRGMVRALTATMLMVGRGKLTIANFKNIIESKDCTKASFAVPAQGLFLVKVSYPFDFQFYK